MKTKTSFVTKVFIAALVAATCSSAVAQRTPRSIGAEAVDLFASATEADANSVAKVDSDVLRRRVVRVNFAGLAKQTRVGGKLKVNLFNDVSVPGTVDKVEDR